jgi:O-succinylbenzoate synthase
MIEPFRISSGEVSAKDSVLVRLSDGDAFGWGESSAMSGNFYSTETPDSCQRELVETVLPALLGRTFDSMLELEAELARLSSSRFVRIAVESAAWELIARARNLSLRQLFGLPHHPVPSGLAIGLYPTIEELLAAIERYQVADYSRLKIKIKRGQDLELVRAVRQQLPDVGLYVDANADYTLADLDIFRQLDRYNLMMFEQPFAREAFEDSARLQRTVRTPICMDESIETLADLKQAIALDACRIVNMKLQRVGGFLEALRIMEACLEHGIPVWMGTMPELGIGSAQALVLATHPACRYPTDVEPSTRWFTGDILSPELTLSEQHIELPHGPGLGYTVDPDALARYQLRHWSFGA